MLPERETTTLDTVVVQFETLESVVRVALESHGALCESAAIQARTLVEGDLRGHPSHGVRRLPTLVARLAAGVADGRAVPELSWVAESALRVDGRRCLGPVAAHAAIDELLARARVTGIAMATISNSNHIGMTAPYVERIAEHGAIGIVLTTSEALVHAWGGSGAVLGTNPIGIGVPGAPGSSARPAAPLILDMSTAAVSMGKVIDYAATGRDLPPGWAVDAHGRPTADASAAIGGAISPFGGPKGYALGLALEALVGTLTASSFGQEVRGTLDTEHVATKGDVIVVMSLERLGVAGALPRLHEYLDDVRSNGEDGPVDVPGERARRSRARRSEQGVPLDRASWQRAQELAGVGADV